MNRVKLNNHVVSAIWAFLLLLIFAGCANRIEVRREWPVPLKINPAILKQCNIIHNNTCPFNSGEMTDATYYFDKRKLPAIESKIAEDKTAVKSGPAYREIVNIKKIESASAYSATFIRTECSIEYYVQGKNVTCEKFLQYIEKLQDECDSCLEILKIGPAESSEKYTGNSTEKLFFE